MNLDQLKNERSSIATHIRKKVPISLIIDDPAPMISVYYTHHHPPFTDDGRPLAEYFPNSFLEEFCDIVEQNDIKGKFSVVPMPGNRGDIVNGLTGVSPTALAEWLNTVKTRLVPAFTVGPEMLTHNKAVDLHTMTVLDQMENAWAADKDRTVLTPYIAFSLKLLQDAGFDVCGVTSPWDFGITVEEEYAAAISQAVWEVTGKKNAWYFLRDLCNTPHAKPWVQREEEGRCVVSIPATTNDVIWDTIHTTDSSEAFVRARADMLITADGRSGQIIQVLETDGYPILLTHWQSLFSNGLKTGLRILNEVAERVNTHLSDRVEWMSFAQILDLVLADKAAFPKPVFAD